MVFKLNTHRGGMEGEKGGSLRSSSESSCVPSTLVPPLSHCQHFALSPSGPLSPQVCMLLSDPMSSLETLPLPSLASIAVS